MTTAIETNYSQMCYDLADDLNNRWKVDAIESSNHFYHKLEVEVAKKYVKIWVSHVPFKGDSKLPSRSIWMFVDKTNGFCYKPASTKHLLRVSDLVSISCSLIPRLVISLVPFFTVAD